MTVIADYVQTQPYNDQESTTHIRAHLICDTQSDLPAPTDIPLYTLDMGSKADIIADSTEWKMQSDGSWIQQLPPEAAATYSKAEIDQMIDTINHDMQDLSVDIRDVGIDVTDLTSRVTDDETVLKDLIDTGAKNVFTTSAGTSTITDITFTNNGDGTWTASGTAAARRQKSLAFTVPSSLSAGQYILSGCPEGGVVGSSIIYCLYLWDTTDNVRISQNDTGSGTEFSWTPDPTHTYQIVIDIRSGTTADNLLFMPMICTQADWKLSQDFVPYTPTLRDLYLLVKSYHP